MKNSLLAARYARAVIELVEKDQHSLLEEDARVLEELAQANPQLLQELNSVLLPREKRAELVNALCANLNLAGVWEGLFKLLLAKNRPALIAEIAPEVEALLLALSGRVRVELILAKKHSEQVVSSIETRVQNIIGKQVIFRLRYDPTILGGFVANAPSMRIDASIKHNLERFGQMFGKQRG